jgi:uncharacterized protein (TIGR02599 family)
MKYHTLSSHRRATRGFTLVEVLVSSVLIVAIMVLLLGTVDQTQRLWQRARSKTTQFQSARAAFEVMSRRVGQATLNTYWRAHEGADDAAAGFGKEQANFRFRRQSELQFISGPTLRFLQGSSPIQHVNDPIDENYPTHAIFFHAPLGYTELAASASSPVKQFRDLDSTLTACGYFVEFGDDPSVPSFVRTMKPAPPPHYRYRLMEMTEPTERFNIYARPKDSDRLMDPRIFDEKATSSNASYYEGMVDVGRVPRKSWVRPLWMKEALKRTQVPESDPQFYRFQYTRPIAENVIALIVLPKLAVKDRVTSTNVADPNVLELAPFYDFDTWRVLSGGTVKDAVVTSEDIDNRARDNLLPPIVQLTMVAIDEVSAARMDLKMDGKPNWTKDLFPKPGVRVDKVKEYEDRIADLENALRNDPDHPNINYRIFTTDVVIRGSKWSRDPKN